MKKENYELSDLISDACDTYDEEIENYTDKDDAIHEIADQAVPIYYYDIAQYCANNFHLMQDIPETGTNQEPYKQIQANIYEQIIEGLYEHIAEKEKDLVWRKQQHIKQL